MRRICHREITNQPNCFSTQLFAREHLGRISTGAFLYAAFTGVELLVRHQPAGVISLTAERILPALVPELVFTGADLGRIWPAGKVEAMATGELTDGRECRCRGRFNHRSFTVG